MSGWMKSSHSTANGHCVEVCIVDDGAVMRDSKDRSGPVLHFTPAEWAAFTAGVKAGEFDLLAGSAPA